MICPCCGNNMELDGHRKIDLFMCYDCGYIEGSRIENTVMARATTNFERLLGMNFNEASAFIARNMNVNEGVIHAWLEKRTA